MISPPRISGTAEQGLTLTAARGTWTGSPTRYTYHWQNCDTGGANCTPITGADQPSYLVVPGNVGRRILVREWATNAAGRSEVAVSAPTAVVPELPFFGDFETGSPRPFDRVQCVNYGSLSVNHRQRGTFHINSTIVGQGRYSGEFDLPVNTGVSSVDGTSFTLTQCETLRSRTIGLGSDQYYGLMVYVPPRFSTGTHAFWGVSIAQFNTEFIWGSPFQLQLHDNHVTLAVQTGPCRPSGAANPGCAWHSNADNPNGHPGNLPAFHAVPRGRLVPGWTKLIFHAHWANNTSGSFDTWMQAPGQTGWTHTVHYAGIPTIQTNVNRPGVVPTTTVDGVGAYRGSAYAPVKVILDNFVAASRLGFVQATMSAACSPSASRCSSGRR